jgi:hypothetical protein
VIAGLLGAAALLLVVAGAGKVVDPTRTVGALKALGWPSSPWLVRLGALAETLLGATALVVDGQVWGLLVAASYLGFTLFVISAIRADTPLASCGCFAQVDTPPRPAHVVVTALLAGGAVLSSALDAAPLFSAPWTAWLVAFVTATIAGSALVGRGIVSSEA